MLFMVIETFKDNDMRPVYRHLQTHGRGLPEGLRQLHRYRVAARLPFGMPLHAQIEARCLGVGKRLRRFLLDNCAIAHKDHLIGDDFSGT